MPDLATNTDAPFLAEVTRGSIVESRHAGIAAVVDATGAVVHGWGNIDQAIYPRSAIKALQALALVECGAADTHDCTEAEIALACASHFGMPMHTEPVAAWLHRLGLSEDDLNCGAHYPMDRSTANQLVATATRPGPLHNNCSGKHTAMLTTALHLGAPTAGYEQPGHPVQRQVTATLSAMYGCDLAAAPYGTDGCSIPTIAVPLRNVALAMAKFGAPDDLPPDRATAARRIFTAVTSHPALTAKPGYFDTDVMQELGPVALIKTGAEGVYCAAVPDRGLGVALKILDGAPRGARVAMAAVLRRLGVIDDAAAARLAANLTEPLFNHNRLHIGDVRPGDCLAPDQPL